METKQIFLLVVLGLLAESSSSSLYRRSLKPAGPFIPTTWKLDLSNVKWTLSSNLTLLNIENLWKKNDMHLEDDSLELMLLEPFDHGLHDTNINIKIKIPTNLELATGTIHIRDRGNSTVWEGYISQPQGPFASLVYSPKRSSDIPDQWELDSSKEVKFNASRTSAYIVFSIRKIDD